MVSFIPLIVICVIIFGLDYLDKKYNLSEKITKKVNFFSFCFFIFIILILAHNSPFLIIFREKIAKAQIEEVKTMYSITEYTEEEIIKLILDSTIKLRTDNNLLIRHKGSYKKISSYFLTQENLNDIVITSKVLLQNGTETALYINNELFNTSFYFINHKEDYGYYYYEIRVNDNSILSFWS